MLDEVVSENVAFLRKRAMVERQQGTNQLLCGADSGKWRLTRANRYDSCADTYAILQSEIMNLRSELQNLKDKIKKKKINLDD